MHTQNKIVENRKKRKEKQNKRNTITKKKGLRRYNLMNFLNI